MWPVRGMGTTGHSLWLCMAAHSSPGSRPILEAQRKPRLSDAESGVLPILPPEKGRENEHVEKGALGLTQLSCSTSQGLLRPGGPKDCGGRGLERSLVRGQSWGHEAALGLGGGSDGGPERLSWKAGEAMTSTCDCWWLGITQPEKTCWQLVKVSQRQSVLHTFQKSFK